MSLKSDDQGRRKSSELVLPLNISTSSTAERSISRVSQATSATYVGTSRDNKTDEDGEIVWLDRLPRNPYSPFNSPDSAGPFLK